MQRNAFHRAIFFLILSLMDDVETLVWRAYYTRHVLPLVRSCGFATATPVGVWGFGTCASFLFTRAPGGGVRPVGGLWVSYPDEGDASILLEGGAQGVAHNWAVSRSLLEDGYVKDKIEEIFV